MFWRKWFTISIGIVLALTLSACSSTGSWLSDTSGSHVGAKTKPYYRHFSFHQKGSTDNVATQDYFAQSSLASNSRNNLWIAIRQDFQLQHSPNNPAVEAQISWFVHNQGYLDRTARRAAPFMYYIFQQVKARNLPSELVLLPIIESAYNPFVSNPSGATGLWEIMPGTGHSFGLREDWWYDGRRDIAASTNAALDYFSYLQNFFGGNWLLAIAAYDTGQGNVEAAIRHNTRLGLSTDYWSLPLAAETRSYIPKLLALAAIVDDPQKYGIHLPPINNAPYLSQVEISSKITLSQAANMAGMTLVELKTLNPGYRRTTLDPNQPYRLLLPLDRINFFKQNLLNLSTNQGSLWSRYKVQSGDTWKKIAKQFNTSKDLIQQVNHLEDKSLPVTGMILLIPENAQNEGALAATATTQTTDTSSTDTSTDNTVTNATTTPAVIQTADDTSTTNEETTNTNNDDSDTADSDNADDITIEAPDLSDAAHLDSGAMAMVARKNAISAAPSHHGLALYKIIHKAKRGETLSSIAHSHHVSTEEVARWNRLSRHSHLRTGQKIIIWYRGNMHTLSHHRHAEMKNTEQERHAIHTHHRETSTHEKNTSHTVSHIVRYKVHAGDTLDVIARKHRVSVNEVAKWNKLSPHSHLHPGQSLVIYTK